MTGISSTGPKKTDIAGVFTQVYDTDAWRRAGTSGPGSAIQHTEAYRAFLQQVLRNYRISRVLDLGCGLWEHLAAVDWTGVEEYLGVDPVKSVIARNKQLPLRANFKFQCGLIDDVAELASYELVIVKDVMQHLPNSIILELLEKLKVVRYALITNDISPGANTDCVIGEFRKMDMEKPPFNLVPIDRIDFRSVPFVKRTLLIRNGVNASAPTSSMLTFSSTI